MGVAVRKRMSLLKWDIVWQEKKNGGHALKMLPTINKSFLGK